MLLVARGQMAYQDQNAGVLIAQTARQPWLSLEVTRKDFDLFCSLLAAGEQFVGPAASTGSAFKGTLSV